MLEKIHLGGCMRLNGISLYALARNSQGDIREIVVRQSGWRYYANDINAHIVVDGSGRGFSNVWDLKKVMRDKDWRQGRVIVSILAGYKPTPPNEKQLRSVTVMLAIMCLGLRLRVEDVKTLSETVRVSEQRTVNSEQLRKDGSDNNSLAVWPGQAGSAGDLIRSWTAAALDDMKNGLYTSIDPNIAEPKEEPLLQLP